MVAGSVTIEQNLTKYDLNQQLETILQNKFLQISVKNINCLVNI